MRTLCVFILCLTVPTALATHNYYNTMSMYPQLLSSSVNVPPPRPRPMLQYRRRKFNRNLPNIIFLKHLMELDCLKEIFNDRRQRNRQRFPTNGLNMKGPVHVPRGFAPDGFRRDPYFNHKMHDLPRKPSQRVEPEGKQFLGVSRTFVGLPSRGNSRSSFESTANLEGHVDEKDVEKDEVNHEPYYTVKESQEYRRVFPEKIEVTEKTEEMEESRVTKKSGEETKEMGEEFSEEYSTTDVSVVDDFLFPMMVSFGDDKQYSKFSQQPTLTTLSQPEVLYQYKWQTRKPRGNRTYEVEEVFEGNVTVDVGDVKKEDHELEYRRQKIYKVDDDIRAKENTEEEVKITVESKQKKEKMPEAMIGNSINEILRGLINPAQTPENKTLEEKDKEDSEIRGGNESANSSNHHDSNNTTENSFDGNKQTETNHQNLSSTANLPEPTAKRTTVTQTKRQKAFKTSVKTTTKVYVTEDPNHREKTTKDQNTTSTTPSNSVKQKETKTTPVYLVTQQITKTTKQPKLSTFLMPFKVSKTKEDLSTPKMSSTMTQTPTTRKGNTTVWYQKLTTPGFSNKIVPVEAKKLKPPENFVLQEVEWKNSRKMHFEANKSDIAEHRRSDIVITDNTKKYTDNDNRVTAVSYIKKLKKNGSGLVLDPVMNLTYKSIIPLIPIVINDLRDNKISSDDNVVLSEYFGKYWPYILALSNNTHLDLLPLIQMKDEADLKNILRSYGVESSTTTSTERPNNNPEEYDNVYDYIDDYKSLYQDVFGQGLELDEEKKLRVKRDEDMRSEATREYFESIEQEQKDEENDHMSKSVDDDFVGDVDWELINETNLFVNLTRRHK